MIYCQGHWDELATQCQHCENIHVFSLYMDGNHTYHCGKYTLTDKDESCPRFLERKKDIATAPDMEEAQDLPEEDNDA